MRSKPVPYSRRRGKWENIMHSWTHDAFTVVVFLCVYVGSAYLTLAATGHFGSSGKMIVSFKDIKRTGSKGNWHGSLHSWWFPLRFFYSHSIGMGIVSQHSIYTLSKVSSPETRVELWLAPEYNFCRVYIGVSSFINNHPGGSAALVPERLTSVVMRICGPWSSVTTTHTWACIISSGRNLLIVHAGIRVGQHTFGVPTPSTTCLVRRQCPFRNRIMKKERHGVARAESPFKCIQ